MRYEIALYFVIIRFIVRMADSAPFLTGVDKPFDDADNRYLEWLARRVRMAEWTNATVCKTVARKGYPGSNPGPDTKKIVYDKRKTFVIQSNILLRIILIRGEHIPKCNFIFAFRKTSDSFSNCQTDTYFTTTRCSPFVAFKKVRVGDDGTNWIARILYN